MAIHRFVVAAALLAWCAGQRLPRPDPGVAECLDQYDKGRYNDGLRCLADAQSYRDLHRLRSDLQSFAPPWIVAVGETASPRRRIVVGAFVLEVAHAIFASEQAHVGLGPRQDVHNDELTGLWRAELRPMVEWACGLLRGSQHAAPAEREWFLASVQLFKDFHDLDAFPLAAHGVDPNMGPLYGDTPGHLGHAIGRFPDEKWFSLIAAERRTGHVFQFARARLDVASATTPTVAYSGPGSETEGPAIAEDYQRASRALSALQQDSVVGPEARLYLGGIAMAFGQAAQARSLFDAVAHSSSDACLTYAAALLRGRIDDLADREGDAASAYQEALTVVPRSQSASVALATLLWLGGHHHEATAVVDASVAEPLADDPWPPVFADRGCTRWSLFITALRAELQ